MRDKEIVVAMLPVLWGIAGEKLHELVQIYQPAMIISFGEADFNPVRLELTAHNVRGEYYNDGDRLPETHYIYRDGPQAINTALPIAQIQSALQKKQTTL